MTDHRIEWIREKVRIFFGESDDTLFDDLLRRSGVSIEEKFRAFLNNDIVDPNVLEERLFLIYKTYYDKIIEEEVLVPEVVIKPPPLPEPPIPEVEVEQPDAKHEEAPGKGKKGKGGKGKKGKHKVEKIVEEEEGGGETKEEQPVEQPVEQQADNVQAEEEQKTEEKGEEGTAAVEVIPDATDLQEQVQGTSEEPANVSQPTEDVPQTEELHVQPSEFTGRTIETRVKSSTMSATSKASRTHKRRASPSTLVETLGEGGVGEAESEPVEYVLVKEKMLLNKERERIKHFIKTSKNST